MGISIKYQVILRWTCSLIMIAFGAVLVFALLKLGNCQNEQLTLEECFDKFERGIYPHPDDCNKFLSCATTDALDCPAGLHFNPTEFVCDWPANAGCLKVTTPNPDESPETEASRAGAESTSSPEVESTESPATDKPSSSPAPEEASKPSETSSNSLAPESDQPASEAPSSSPGSEPTETTPKASAMSQKPTTELGETTANTPASSQTGPSDQPSTSSESAKTTPEAQTEEPSESAETTQNSSTPSESVESTSKPSTEPQLQTSPESVAPSEPSETTPRLSTPSGSESSSKLSRTTPTPSETEPSSEPQGTSPESSTPIEPSGTTASTAESERPSETTEGETSEATDTTPKSSAPAESTTPKPSSEAPTPTGPSSEATSKTSESEPTSESSASTPSSALSDGPTEPSEASSPPSETPSGSPSSPSMAETSSPKSGQPDASTDAGSSGCDSDDPAEAASCKFPTHAKEPTAVPSEPTEPGLEPKSSVLPNEPTEPSEASSEHPSATPPGSPNTPNVEEPSSPKSGQPAEPNGSSGCDSDDPGEAASCKFPTPAKAPTAVPSEPTEPGLEPKSSVLPNEPTEPSEASSEHPSATPPGSPNTPNVEEISSPKSGQSEPECGSADPEEAASCKFPVQTKEPPKPLLCGASACPEPTGVPSQTIEPGLATAAPICDPAQKKDCSLQQKPPLERRPITQPPPALGSRVKETTPVPELDNREPLTRPPQPGGFSVKECVAQHKFGIFAHPTDPTKFFMCSKLKPLELTCGQGLQFDPEAYGCNRPKVTPPPPPPNLNLHECLMQNKRGMFAHHSDCSRFFACSRRGPIEMVCPGGLHFNPVKLVCDWPSKYCVSPGAKTRDKIFQTMKSDKIAPDVVDRCPEKLAEVAFPSGGQVDLGKELTPSQTLTPPSIYWEADKKSFYTLCMVDPDAPRTKGSNKFNEWNHWTVGNIPGNQISQGQPLVEYLPPCPQQNSPPHRYTYMVYKQPRRINFNEPRVLANAIQNRVGFSLRNFALKYQLGNPIAGNFFKCRWDRSVPMILQRLRIQTPQISMSVSHGGGKSKVHSYSYSSSFSFKI